MMLSVPIGDVSRDDDYSTGNQFWCTITPVLLLEKNVIFIF